MGHHLEFFYFGPQIATVRASNAAAKCRCSQDGENWFPKAARSRLLYSV
jgi:hypothetical protein